MGITRWWKKRRGHLDSPALDEHVESAGQSAGATRVATEKLNDRFMVHEYRHETTMSGRTIAVRTFMTEGLSAWDAEEVLVMVPADWSETAVGMARNVLAVQAQLAAQGRPARLGGFTGFKTRTLPGVELAGVVYARGESIRGIPNARSALVAVLLHPEEFELIQQGLSTRVLGLLASRARRFPYPPCWEIRTTPVLRSTEQANSFLEKAPRARLGDIRVTVIGDALDDPLPVARVRLSLPANAAGSLAAHLGDTSMRWLTFLTELAPDADGQATWIPGATQRQMNTTGTAMPRRLGCAFLMVAGGDETPQLRYIEDGVGLILTNAMFDRLRDALITGTELTLQVDDRTELVVQFRPEVISDPFTGAALHSRGGWERYEPTVPRADERGRSAMEVKQIVLLLTDDQLESRVSMAAFASFVVVVQETLERMARLHPVESPVQVVVGVTLVPDKNPRVQLAFQGDRAPELFTPLATELAALAPVPVRDEVPFRIDAILRTPPSNN